MDKILGECTTCYEVFEKFGRTCGRIKPYFSFLLFSRIEPQGNFRLMGLNAIYYSILFSEKSKVSAGRPTACDPMDYSPWSSPGRVDAKGGLPPGGLP